MTLVVLGWDGLDWTLVNEFDLAYRFGTHTARLETISNPELEKPHTYEIWPTIITGAHPETHGLRYQRQVGSQWSNPFLNAAERLSAPIPDSIRWRVGRLLRDRGAGFEFESLDYFAENGLETVFDNRRSFPLAIPNARSRYDAELGIVDDRGAYLAEYLTVSTGQDGTTVHYPADTPAALRRRLEADMGRKLGAARAAVTQEFDLVFVWLAYLDTMGHVAPTVPDREEWQRRAYHLAADLTADIRFALSPEDTLICVSDHGLRDGKHTEDAVYGQFHPDTTHAPAHVLEVAATIDTLAPQTERADGASSPVHTKTDTQPVADRLRDLGYID